MYRARGTGTGSVSLSLPRPTVATSLVLVSTLLHVVQYGRGSPRLAWLGHATTENRHVNLGTCGGNGDGSNPLLQLYHLELQL